MLKKIFLITGVMCLLASPSFCQATKQVQVTIRDFFESHSDFENPPCGGNMITGIVKNQLNPVTRKPEASGAPNACPAAKIEEWFKDIAGTNVRYCDTLTLNQVTGSPNEYQIDQEWFFPLDDKPSNTEAKQAGDGQMHNFHFCLEMHATFQYRGGEVFEFSGDDDVYVFINNQLALDLGHIHTSVDGSVDLDADAADLGISVGNFYNFDFFYCERQTTESHMRLTTSIDLLPPPPPGLHIADENLNIIMADTITINKTGAARTFNSVQLRNVKQDVDCNSVSSQIKDAVSGTWMLGSTSLTTGSSVSIDPAAHAAGVYALTVSDGTSQDRIYVNIYSAPVPPPPPTPPEITFTDMAGTPITSIEGKASGRFKVVLTGDSIPASPTVTLTSTDGDNLTVTLAPRQGGGYEAVVDFGFSETVSTTNQVIEGKRNTAQTLNSSTITATFRSVKKDLTISTAFVSVDNARIIDGDADGQADTIFVKYKSALLALPDSITSIDWPAEGGNNFTATKDEMSFLVNPDGTVDKSVVVIVLSGDTFEEEMTGASAEAPPYITIDGVQVPLQDNVKPVLVEVEKHPSDYNRYMVVTAAGDSIIYTQPDTLYITTSEPISFIDESQWQNMLTVTQGDSTTFTVPIVGKPQRLDSLTWIVLIDNKPGTPTVMSEDDISLNPAAPITDGANNKPAEYEAPTDGRDGTKSATNNQFRERIAGDPESAKGVVLGNETIPVLNESSELLGTHKQAIVLKDKWVPPVGLNSKGIVDPNAPCVDDKSEKDFPRGCLSALAIRTEETDGPYIASVQIFDHMGKFLRAWKQRFGYCGEFQNADRRAQSGMDGVFINDLVWNQRDSDGKAVGSGVYFWKVDINFKNGDGRQLEKRMGVVRNAEMNDPSCAGN